MKVLYVWEVNKFVDKYFVGKFVGGAKMERGAFAMGKQGPHLVYVIFPTFFYKLNYSNI